MNEDRKMHYIFGALLGIAGLVILLIFVTLSSQAENEPLGATTTLDNTAPTIDSVYFGTSAAYTAGTQASGNETGGTLDLEEAPATAGGNTTVDVVVEVTYTDVNGCTEVEDSGDYSIALRHTGVSLGTASGGFCSAALIGDEECYSYQSTGCTDSCAGGVDTDGTISCTFSVPHFALQGTWYVDAGVDDGSAFFVEDTGNTSLTVNQLTAIGLLDTGLNFGNLSLGSTTTAGLVTTGIRNGGNDNTTHLGVYGDDYTCSGQDAGSFTVDYTKFSSSSVAYESAVGVAGSSPTANTAGIILGKQHENSIVLEDDQKDTLYWGLQTPSSGYSGTCTTTITVVGQDSAF